MKRILENHPNARIVVISGQQKVNTDKVDADAKNAIKDYIVKPCDLNELSKIVLKALRS